MNASLADYLRFSLVSVAVTVLVGGTPLVAQDAASVPITPNRATSKLADSGAAASNAASLEAWQVADVPPHDSRLGALKDLNGYFPFLVPDDREQWDRRADELRRRILVSTGIWPLPEKTELNPVIHGKVERPGFTVEKVYFESVPDHFVTGLLFRPANDNNSEVKRPAVLCPHGHGGRMQDYGAEAIRQLIADGAERFEASGRFPKIARCVQLARMGCVVFIFDMLGYGDSQQISDALAHRFSERRHHLESSDRWGFFSAQAEMRLQSIMGLQTWNSIRCLDFLEQLPDVDPNRIGVTGGSGGGTQTILLCAIDPRPATAFPNGMVSTAMQGGCTCENCSLLRIGTGNVELAALFAPKPQAMTAANDWTRDMLEKGYPELQRLYSMLGAKNDVYCRELLHFPHNYNSVSRATMYTWFNKYLKLGQIDPVLEEDFFPLSPEESTVWNADHPLPPGGDDYELSLTRYLADSSDQQLAALAPNDAATLERYRRVVGAAVETLIGRALPRADEVTRTKVAEDKSFSASASLYKDLIHNITHGERFPIVTLYPIQTEWNGHVVLWLDGDGKRALFQDNGNLRPAVQALVDRGAAIIGADLYAQGEFLVAPLLRQRVVENPREAPCYTYCYNDTLFAQRVHDILTLITYATSHEQQPRHVHLVATQGAGPVTAAARAIAGSSISKASIDTQGFRFVQITDYRAPDFLPGAVKYGDLPAFLALQAPAPLALQGETETPAIALAAYQAADAPGAIVTDMVDLTSWLLD